MVIDIINAVIDGINAFPVSAVNMYGQILGLLLSGLALAGIIFIGKRIEGMSRAAALKDSMQNQDAILHAEQIFKEKTEKSWKDIMVKINSNNASDWLLAVIQADAMVDDILKRMSLPGETMAERLQQLDASKLATLQDVWDAHKIRNRVAHAPSTMLRRDELYEAIEKYRRALRELGLIK